jgi:hypothetical protein
MGTLDFDKLKAGLPEISSAFGALFAEAAAFCLTNLGHKPGVRLQVEGDVEAVFSVVWTELIGTFEISSWNDQKEAVEYGATAIAILLILELTGYNLFRREDQAQGTDYELRVQTDSGEKSQSPIAKLEISGIMNENLGNTLAVRVSLKESKIKKRGNVNLPVYIVVVEFGTPKAKLIKI